MSAVHLRRIGASTTEVAQTHSSAAERACPAYGWVSGTRSIDALVDASAPGPPGIRATCLPIDPRRCRVAEEDVKPAMVAPSKVVVGPQRGGVALWPHDIAVEFKISQTSSQRWTPGADL